MRLPKQTVSAPLQRNGQPMVGTIEPAFLDSIVDGLFGLGALVCEAFSGKEREECLRGYNMVANPVKGILKPITSIL